jgi:hypothetical protein
MAAFRKFSCSFQFDNGYYYTTEIKNMKFCIKTGYEYCYKFCIKFFYELAITNTATVKILKQQRERSHNLHLSSKVCPKNCDNDINII